MFESPKLSVIIANFNYERFLPDAIASALAIDWPSVEVIVVDDGSTDDSRKCMKAFGSQIRVIYQANQGQRIANNIGFALSSGDAVIFLDADDIVMPALAKEVFAVWSANVSKVQVQIARVDARGRPLGTVLPTLRGTLTPEAIRSWALRSGEYPSPPGSGNIYARHYLEAIFPIEEERDTSTDTTCIAMAPFFGDVITVAKPLVLYRIHGENDSSLHDDRRFAREISRAGKRLLAAQEASGARGFNAQAPDALLAGKHLLQLRIASLRLRPHDHPLLRDTRLRALVDALMVPFRSGYEPVQMRLLIAGWSVLALVLPHPLASRLIKWRFTPRPTLRCRFGFGKPIITK